MPEDEISRRLAAALPELDGRPGQLSSRQEAVLERVITGQAASRAHARTAPAPMRRWRVAAPLAASLAAALVIGVVILTVLVQSPVAHAATPPLLTTTPVAGTPRELLTEIAQSVREQGRPASDAIVLQQWAWALDADSEHPPQLITPERVEIRFLLDGGKEFNAWAAASYDGQGRPVTDSELPVGVHLWSLTSAPGSNGTLFVAEPPTSPSDVGAYFVNEGVIATGSAAEYLIAVQDLLRSRPLSSAQEAAVIEFLASLADLSVTGKTVDRLGREGIMFTAESAEPTEHTEAILVNASDGILAFEETYVGEGRAELRAPAVINYVAWEERGSSE